MKKIFFPALFVLTLTACSDSKTKTTDVLADSATINTTVVPSTLPAASPTLPAPTNNTVSPNTIITPTVVTTPTTTQTTTTTASTAGLNPAHGQPGHRCDISVGAPLNSKPNPTTTAVTPTVTTSTAPVSTVTTQTSSPNPITAPGMNPAHGQPGHRCDISVGAPLNSKPATNPITVKPASDSSKN